MPMTTFQSRLNGPVPVCTWLVMSMACHCVGTVVGELRVKPPMECRDERGVGRPVGQLCAPFTSV